MAKLALALAVVAAATFLRPAAASAHRAVILGGPPVVFAPAPCGGVFYPGYVPGYVSPPGGFIGIGPDLRVRDPESYYRWYYGQYFTPRSERIHGYTLPGRR